MKRFYERKKVDFNLSLKIKTQTIGNITFPVEFSLDSSFNKNTEKVSLGNKKDNNKSLLKEFYSLRSK